MLPCPFHLCAMLRMSCAPLVVQYQLLILCKKSNRDYSVCSKKSDSERCIGHHRSSSPPAHSRLGPWRLRHCASHARSSLLSALIRECACLRLTQADMSNLSGADSSTPARSPRHISIKSSEETPSMSPWTQPPTSHRHRHAHLAHQPRTFPITGQQSSSSSRTTIPLPCLHMLTILQGSQRHVQARQDFWERARVHRRHRRANGLLPLQRQGNSLQARLPHDRRQPILPHGRRAQRQV